MREVHVAIVGTGFAGLGMAIRLKQQGMTDFVLLEKAHEVGGTWRDNTYPGAACDVPSHMYSFSFAPNPDWSRSFSPQPEILRYLRHCADHYGVRPYIRFGHEVQTAKWDEQRFRWRIGTSKGEYLAKVLILGAGPLSEPSYPDIPGRDSFAGTMFHSARWDHDYDLAGKQVAVIGTGASAIQFVPQIQRQVGRLHLFQRTPPWVMPRVDRAVTGWEQRLFRRLPLAQRLARASVYWTREASAIGFTIKPALMKIAERGARLHLRRSVPDRKLRRKLTPNFRFGCKRVLLSNDYFPALNKPNVDVITEGIAEIRPHSVVTADGVERKVDAIIFGTGFHATDQPSAQIATGIGGLRLADAWKDGMQAYLGTAIAGFPNLFMLIGPNTGLGHNSMVFMIESQIAYVLDALRHLKRGRLAAVGVREEVQEQFNTKVQQRLARTVWQTGGCSSWYQDASGRNTTLWPSFTWQFRLRTRRFDAQSYWAIPDIGPRQAPVPLPAAATGNGNGTAPTESTETAEAVAG